jgi:two-component system, OmpR family, alkaline phosphatase synthesis response regulator PhoP
MAKILIVEDEKSIQQMIEYDLTQLGYQVETASDGLLGYQKALKGDFDIIVLDLMLPSMKGLDIAQKLKAAEHKAYIIMLTAMDEEFQKIEGFEKGADDYMTKPFSPRELSARIKAVLRRQSSSNKKDILIHDQLELNLLSYEATFQGAPLKLTLKEFELLAYLMKNKGLVISRDQLLKSLWGYAYDGDTRVVDVHIFKLRDKIDPQAKIIKTVRGIGYKFI